MSKMTLAGIVLAAAACATPAFAVDSPLQVPPKTLAVLTADISPEMQAYIAKPLNPGWNFHPTGPKAGEEWRAMANEIAAGVLPGLPVMRERLHVKAKETMIDGVNVTMVTPDEIPGANDGRLRPL